MWHCLWIDFSLITFLCCRGRRRTFTTSGKRELVYCIYFSSADCSIFLYLNISCLVTVSYDHCRVERTEQWELTSLDWRAGNSKAKRVKTCCTTYKKWVLSGLAICWVEIQPRSWCILTISDQKTINHRMWKKRGLIWHQRNTL